MSNITTATVETLTAEVRVLMVGSRQITLSVARQLDEVDPDDIEPFGRIRTGAREPFGAIAMIEVIGADREGVLVRSTGLRERYRCDSDRGYSPEMARVHVNGQEAISLRCPDHQPGIYWAGHFWEPDPDFWWEWSELPLIVLAGLR